jgi:hypothetical protein
MACQAKVAAAAIVDSVLACLLDSLQLQQLPISLI